MKAIHKYALTLASMQYVAIPEGARILSTAVRYLDQRDSEPSLFVWAEVDPAQLEVPRGFRLYRTGEQLDEGVEETYVGTVQVALGALIFHLYDRGEVVAANPEL